MTADQGKQSRLRNRDMRMQADRLNRQAGVVGRFLDLTQSCRPSAGLSRRRQEGTPRRRRQRRAHGQGQPGKGLCRAGGRCGVNNGRSWVTVQRGRRATMFPIARAIAACAKSAHVVGPVVFIGCITEEDPRLQNLMRMELTLEAAEKLLVELTAAVKAAKDNAEGAA